MAGEGETCGGEGEGSWRGRWVLTRLLGATLLAACLLRRVGTDVAVSVGLGITDGRLGVELRDAGG